MPDGGTNNTLPRPSLICTVGLPASGKTSWARGWVARDPARRARVNGDDVRWLVFGRYWDLVDSRHYPLARQIQRDAVRDLLRAGISVVVDDTNLHEDALPAWRDLAEDEGAVRCLVRFDVPLPTLILRDRDRMVRGERAVGANVIYEMAERYLPKRYLPKTSEPEPGWTEISHEYDDPHVSRAEDGTVPTVSVARGIPRAVDRLDGLTPEEGRVMDALVVAVDAFSKLPSQHPNETPDFIDGIHCQYLLGMRVARRYHPDGWPIKPG